VFLRYSGVVLGESPKLSATNVIGVLSVINTTFITPPGVVRLAFAIYQQDVQTVLPLNRSPRSAFGLTSG
jgi:hypothetical protein